MSTSHHMYSVQFIGITHRDHSWTYGRNFTSRADAEDVAREYLDKYPERSQYARIVEEKTVRIIKHEEEYVKAQCRRCGRTPFDWPPQKLWDIATISESSICADCVMDLMMTDPTCESVTRFIKEAESD